MVTVQGEVRSLGYGRFEKDEGRQDTLGFLGGMGTLSDLVFVWTFVWTCSGTLCWVLGSEMRPVSPQLENCPSSKHECCSQIEG